VRLLSATATTASSATAADAGAARWDGDDVWALRFQTRVLESVTEAIIATDLDAGVVYWNRAAEELYGWQRAEVMGRNLREVITSEAVDGQAAAIFESMIAGKSWKGDYPVRHRDGTEFIALVTTSPMLDEDGRLVAIIGVSTDVTELRRIEAESSHAAAIVASSADAIISTTVDGDIVSWNPGAEAMIGFGEAEAIGQHLGLFTPASGGAEQADLVRRTLGGESISGIETTRVRRDGSEFPVSITLSPIVGPKKRVVGISGVLRDITDQKALEANLEHRALYDSLTDLPNRTLLSDRLAHALDRASRGGPQPSLLLLDIDAFKTINDSFGHATGDQALSEVGRRLRQVTRTADTVARINGNEFAILVEDSDSAAVIHVANRVLAALGAPATVDGHQVLLQASMGIGFGQMGDRADDLLRDADTAMYVAKGAGKGRYRIFEPEMHRAVLERLELASELRGAVARGEIDVFYQPIVDLATGRMVGAEALARWQHPERGPIPPGTFIPIAEDTVQIVELGAHVLGKALQQLGRWQRHHPSTYVTVNASPVQFRSPRFVDHVMAAVATAGIAPSSVVLEVTETGLMTDLNDNIVALADLRAGGVRIAIDDFGTGYSSIAYLKGLPVDIVKIDRSLVPSGTAPDNDWEMTRAILSLVDAVGLETVIEGVEDAGQAAHLNALGAKRAQGYHFARPMPSDQMADMFRRELSLPDDGLS
jgi:diguanylate cyclase (GGDEF)-like protein/PAS domain S-box-containing protein